MNKETAMKLIYEKYDQIKEIVYQLDVKYFQRKGAYHEDITHDLFIKIQEEIDNLENKPHTILKFLDRIINGQMYIIYNKAKQMYINFLKRENKYVQFNVQKLSKREKEMMIEKPKVFQKDDDIQDKVDDLVKTFYWFDQKLFNLYRYEFKMHKTNMSKKTKISISTIFRTVKRCKIKIKEKLKDDYYG